MPTNLAQLIYEAYPPAKGLDMSPDDLTDIRWLKARVTDRRRPIGDTLFEFIVVEVEETSRTGTRRGTTGRAHTAIEDASRAMRTAVDEIEAVAAALENASRNPENDRYCIDCERRFRSARGGNRHHLTAAGQIDADADADHAPVGEDDTDTASG